MLDGLELELLAAGLLERVHVSGEPERLRLSDAGIEVAVRGMARNRAALSAHERLVGDVVALQQQRGRIAWRGLSLRVDVREAFEKQEAAALAASESAAAVASVSGGKAKWVIAMPDVFSVRHTSVEAYLQSSVHEIKVKRADVLGELRKPLKTAAYCQMAAEVWWVFGCDAKGKPIAREDEAPPEVGVLQAWPGAPDATADSSSSPRFEVLRAAPHRKHSLHFSHWMALARASPAETQLEAAQQRF